MLQSRRYRRGGGELPATLRRSCQDAQDTFTSARDSAVPELILGELVHRLTEILAHRAHARIPQAPAAGSVRLSRSSMSAAEFGTDESPPGRLRKG